MNNVSTIKNKKKETICPYCGLVPVSSHPDFTCPRLSGATFGEGDTTVDFIDPERWETIKKLIQNGLTKSGIDD